MSSFTNKESSKEYQGEPIASRDTGRRVLMNGNQAVARGALEAGVRFAASYPGSPTVEVLGSLARAAREMDIHAEWAINEIVALEEAAGASYAGLRAITAMKPDGFNVALDFVTALTVAGVKAGLVILVGDDPAAHSGVKEEDCRPLAKAAGLPILEPAGVDQARLMTKAAFQISEALKLPVLVRATTRICHSSGDVELGPLPDEPARVDYNPKDRFITYAPLTPYLKKKLAKAAELSDESPFNRYIGPDQAKRLVIASGVSAAYAAEALAILGLSDQVGLLILGLTYPLPAKKLLGLLATADEVVFYEEITSFVEDQVLALAAQHGPKVGVIRFHGKNSGEVLGSMGPGMGELTPELVTASLAAIFGAAPPATGFAEEEAGQALALLGGEMPRREHTFCAGCPHRASFWSLKEVLGAKGGQAMITGDIGCYTLALGDTGYKVLKTVHCMGAGLGMAVGMGQLARFGLENPVVAVIGDGTFFHAGLPALINARHQESDLLLIILDNRTTAMTGHQPHPGLPLDSAGNPAPAVELEDLMKGLDVPCRVVDPYDLTAAQEALREMLAASGPRTLVMRRECSLSAGRGQERRTYRVETEDCTGCALCAQELACPAARWDAENSTADIDPALCVGCGVCAELCPAGAIVAGQGEARS